jgi:O-antigen ligase
MSWKALIVILAVVIPAFWGLRLAFGSALPRGVIMRWGIAFAASSFAAFMIPNYWASIILFGVIAIFAASADRFSLPIYALLLFAFPAAGALLPGFMGINNFLFLYTHHVLAIVLLFPMFAMVAAAKMRSGNGRAADISFTLYFLIVAVLSFRDTTFTDGLRQLTTVMLSIVPQYVVFSRVRWTLPRLRLFSAALVSALAVNAAIACAEVILSWPIYMSPFYMWNLPEGSFVTMRGGFLRASASTLSPIGLGMFLVVALSLAPALLYATRRWITLGPAAVLVAGLLATFSRGPWMGAGLALGLHALVSQRPVGNTLRLGIVGVVSLLALSLTPYGDAFLGLLPGIANTVDQSSIDYRQQLWERGSQVVMQNPFFGSETYWETPEMRSMLQGQGIIDIVNGYLHIALDTGLIGLACFLGMIVFSLLALLRSIKPARAINQELALYAQSYFSGFAAMMVVIATASIVVGQITEVVFMLAGVCVGIARSVGEMQKTAYREMAAEEPGLRAPQAAAAPAPAPKGPPPSSLPPHLRQYAKKD